MKTERDEKTIENLVKLYESKLMTVNTEYQRGEIWNNAQQKRLIDSLMRGYKLPLIYLHKKKVEIDGLTRDGLEIIDGQQRLKSIYRYVKGDYRLFDPLTENHIAKFPVFLLDTPGEWAGKFFRELSTSLKRKFLDTKLMLAMIQSSESDEVRDLFIRLQAGSALNEQERRDAWPGKMNEFILELGGKPSITGYPGHEYFPKIMKVNPDKDRGSTRQLAAQITSLIIWQQERGTSHLPDINAAAIDQLYYDHLDFEKDGPVGKRIWKIFDLLLLLLQDRKRPKLRNNDTIHAALLVNSLIDRFTSSWEAEFAPALDEFLRNLKEASKAGVEESDPIYLFKSRYGDLTRGATAGGGRILQRHTFYVEQMLKHMPATTLKDSRRAFSQTERELIYFRQRKTCAVCGKEITWRDANIHHIQEYSRGGKTELKNAALVHASCHPKSKEDVEAFAKKWTGES